jgi:hypothetical protein
MAKHQQTWGPGSAEQRYTLHRVRDTVGIHAASVFSTSLIQYEVPYTMASSLKL